MTSREVARAARRLADQQRAAASAPPDGIPFRATVTTVTAGVVKVTYQGAEVTAGGGYLGSLPAVGDRVVCVYIARLLTVLGKPSGIP